MINFVLHAHMPYINHPEHPGMLEETWLFEALVECYLPLLRMFHQLHQEGIPGRITLSLSPPLICMLQDAQLMSRFEARLQQLQAFCDSEVQRTLQQADFYALACMYQRRLSEIRETYDNIQGDLPAAFARLHVAGQLELITTTATHAFLPLLQQYPAAVKAQIGTATDFFEQTFGFTSRGLWLPECGFYDGLQQHLRAHDIAYSFVETHGLQDATPLLPDRDVYTPVRCGGIAMFGRDPESAEQIWSSEVGYPAHPSYREYYRDIGMELDHDILRPYLIDRQQRSATGLKYYRITGRQEEKQPYHFSEAREMTRQHARDFILCKQHQLERIRTQQPGVRQMITAPFDAELFGHWWFEGPLWLEEVIRQCAADDEAPELATASDYLACCQPLENAVPASSSWGEGGYNQYWLNASNQWIYPLLNDACRRMQKLADDYPATLPGSIMHRALQQAARSLLLAQASDWPFILRSDTSAEYARQRVTDHLARFNFLEDNIRSGHIDQQKLAALETMDSIFPQLDYLLYRTQS